MKSLIHLACLFVLVASGMRVGAASYAGSHTTAPSQERVTQGADDERVYTAGEVDVRAKVTNRMENLPEAGRDCPEEGLVRLRIILHKSGKVTEVRITKGMGCSYDESAVGVARKFKFTPAVKDGKHVSQYQIFEYRYQAY